MTNPHTLSLFLTFHLGGALEDLPYDVSQAMLMVRMQIKLDVYIKSSSEELKSIIRSNLIEFFITFPLPRVFMYLKSIKSLPLGYNSDKHKFKDMRIEGPEDIIAKGVLPFHKY